MFITTLVRCSLFWGVQIFVTIAAHYSPHFFYTVCLDERRFGSGNLKDMKTLEFGIENITL